MYWILLSFPLTIPLNKNFIDYFYMKIFNRPYFIRIWSYLSFRSADLFKYSNNFFFWVKYLNFYRISAAARRSSICRPSTCSCFCNLKIHRKIILIIRFLSSTNFRSERALHLLRRQHIITIIPIKSTPPTELKAIINVRESAKIDIFEYQILFTNSFIKLTKTCTDL